MNHDASFERQRIEYACAALCVGFARALDFTDQDHFLELFTDDAVLVYADRCEGHSAIVRFLGSRARTTTTRHVVSNVWIDVIDDAQARGLSYCTVYAGLAGTAPNAVAVGHAQDRYRCVEGEWKFARRHCHWAFGAPQA
ncbi:MAG: nuclear transport factor 2 family protein [Pseudomonadota bacterium]|nr:nuclear transport factor 2 family protein [Pseudomonadota bacterium]